MRDEFADQGVNNRTICHYLQNANFYTKAGQRDIEKSKPERAVYAVLSATISLKNAIEYANDSKMIIPKCRLDKIKKGIKDLHLSALKTNVEFR